MKHKKLLMSCLAVLLTMTAAHAESNSQTLEVNNATGDASPSAADEKILRAVSAEYEESIAGFRKVQKEINQTIRTMDRVSGALTDTALILGGYSSQYLADVRSGAEVRRLRKSKIRVESAAAKIKYGLFLAEFQAEARSLTQEMEKLGERLTRRPYSYVEAALIGDHIHPNLPVEEAKSLLQRYVLKNKERIAAWRGADQMNQELKLAADVKKYDVAWLKRTSNEHLLSSGDFAEVVERGGGKLARSLRVLGWTLGGFGTVNLGLQGYDYFKDNDPRVFPLLSKAKYVVTEEEVPKEFRNETPVQTAE